MLGIAGCAQEKSPPSSASFPSAEEQTKLYNNCMESRGWVARELEDGSFDYEFSEPQRQQFTADSSECTSEIGADREPEMSDAQWKSFYDRQVGVSDCLANQGVGMPEPPSFQKWMTDARAWGPYGDVPAEVVATRIDELEQACPPLTTY